MTYVCSIVSPIYGDFPIRVVHSLGSCGYLKSTKADCVLPAITTILSADLLYTLSMQSGQGCYPVGTIIFRCIFSGLGILCIFLA